MAVQAIITNVIKDPDAVVVEVTYTDNATFKKTKEYRLASFVLDDFKRTVQGEINGLSQLSADPSKDLPIGPFDPTITPPPPPPPPTQAQLNLQDFSKKLSVLQQYSQYVSLGIMDSADALITSARSDAQEALTVVLQDQGLK